MWWALKALRKKALYHKKEEHFFGLFGGNK